MIGRVKDIDKLIIVAQTYSYLKGPFTANNLSEFIRTNNFKFHSDFNAKRIGSILGRSTKFESKKSRRSTKYEAI